MVKKDGLWTEEFGRLGAILKVLQDGGVTKEHLSRLLKDKGYAERVRAFMIRGGWEESASQQIARFLLGNNFFGVEEWTKFFGVNFTPKQLREVEKFPWSAETLNSLDPFEKKRFGTPRTIKQTHFAFLGIEGINGEPLTMVKLQELCNKIAGPKFSAGDRPWYRDEDFASKTNCKLRWYLMPLNIVSKSKGKVFEEQIALLPPEYEAPLIIEETLKHVLYFLLNNKYLNQGSFGPFFGRGSEIDSGSLHISVGNTFNGISIDNSYGKSAGPSFGIATSRKIPQY